MQGDPEGQDQNLRGQWEEVYCSIPGEMAFSSTETALVGTGKADLFQEGGGSRIFKS
jgi:hypothetical protein